jgi:hypothetical protein
MKAISTNVHSTMIRAKPPFRGRSPGDGDGGLFNKNGGDTISPFSSRLIDPLILIEAKIMKRWLKEAREDVELHAGSGHRQ